MLFLLMFLTVFLNFFLWTAPLDSLTDLHWEYFQAQTILKEFKTVCMIFFRK